MTDAAIMINAKKAIRKWNLLGIPVIIIISSLSHFVYKWSGNSLIAGIFAPVNESVWEHLKMTFLPITGWWISGYYIYRKKCNVSAARWFVSCMVSVLICPIIILSFHYTYEGSFGKESLILDIFSMILGVTLGQFSALHIYKYSKPKQYWLYISIAAISLLGAAFAVFTFNPPKIPLFSV